MLVLQRQCNAAPTIDPYVHILCPPVLRARTNQIGKSTMSSAIQDSNAAVVNTRFTAIRAQNVSGRNGSTFAMVAGSVLYKVNVRAVGTHSWSARVSACLRAHGTVSVPYHSDQTDPAGPLSVLAVLMIQALVQLSSKGVSASPSGSQASSPRR